VSDTVTLRLRRIGGKRVYHLLSVLPGQRQTLNARLVPGLYRLKCTLADHAALGMRAEFRVRKRPSSTRSRDRPNDAVRQCKT
jgi:hypothetical protein